MAAAPSWRPGGPPGNQTVPDRHRTCSRGGEVSDYLSDNATALAGTLVDQGGRATLVIFAYMLAEGVWFWLRDEEAISLTRAGR